MPAPNILPSSVPKQTKFTVGSDVYEFVSIGIRNYLVSMFGAVIVYTGEVKHLLTNVITKNFNAYVHSIEWESIVDSDETTDGDSCEEYKKEIKNCLWCNKKLESNQNSSYCEIGKVYCKEYYFALSERMNLDFRKPEEALDSEKESVVRWVKNYLRIK